MGALVETSGYGPEACERIERPLCFVAACIDRHVKASGPTVGAATVLTVGSLFHALGNGVLDLPPPT